MTTGDGTFAYLRFWSFQANAVDDFVNALTPILPTLPQNGLIFDMRGNSGGYIAAGERVLQLFSATPIVPARFEFRVTDLTTNGQPERRIQQMASVLRRSVRDGRRIYSRHPNRRR